MPSYVPMLNLARQPSLALVPESDPDKDTLASCLNLYGMSHRNVEYHMDRKLYLEWFNETLVRLERDIVFTDRLDCYKKILDRLGR